MGDQDLDVVAVAPVEQEARGELAHASSIVGSSVGWGTRRTRKCPKEPYRTASHTLVPSKLGSVAAAPASIRLAGLAACAANGFRGPGPIIADRSGVGATGPFGQTERYRRGRRAPTDLSTSSRQRAGSCPREWPVRGQSVDRPGWLGRSAWLDRSAGRSVRRSMVPLVPVRGSRARARAHPRVPLSVPIRACTCPCPSAGA